MLYVRNCLLKMSLIKDINRIKRSDVMQKSHIRSAAGEGTEFVSIFSENVT